MELDRELVLRFSQAAIELAVKPDMEVVEGKLYLSCNLGDITVMVRRTPITFAGLTFTAYGLNWIVDEHYRIYLLSFQGKKTEVGPEMAPMVQDYLRHRYYILENFSI